MTRITVTPPVWNEYYQCRFSGAPISSCTPGGKGNLGDLTSLLKKPHNDVDYH